MKAARWILLAPLALLVLVGCLLLAIEWQSQKRFVDSDQPLQRTGPGAELAPGEPLGQTFIARHAGLAGIEFFLLPTTNSPVTLTLHLRADPQSSKDLAITSLYLPPAATSGYYRFAFPPLPASHGQYYYAFLEAAGASASVALAEGKTYLDGAAYQDHRPLQAQTTFRLVYAPATLAFDLLKAALTWGGLLVIVGLLFVVPGWALLAWLWPRRLSWAETLGLAVGISLSLYPLLILWTDSLGLHLGPLYAWIPGGAGLAALAWRYRAWRPPGGRARLGAWSRSEVLWPDLALLIVTAGLFAVRLLVVRTLQAPLWGDSYQHTLMTQLLLDHGGLFNSWEPYTPYRSLTVHFGFPSMAALLPWMRGIGSIQSTLLTGQIVNGLAVLALYPLAVRLARGNRWAGVGAILVAGLVSPTPAYYVNWGRYAQLAGQAILPVTLWLTWEAVEDSRVLGRSTWLAGATAAGMTLSYYRMPFYYGTFLLAWLLAWGLPRWRISLRQWLPGVMPLMPIAVTWLVLSLPWIVALSDARLAAGLGQGIAQGTPLNRVLADYQVWLDIDFYVPWPLLIAALAALAYSLLRRQWVVASLGLWVLALASLVAAGLVHLPGANKMQNFAILIALYIPVSLLVGWLIGQMVSVLERRARKAGQWAAGTAILVLALAMLGRQTRIVDPSFVLVTHPDARAMDWIEENTPPEARFLVEGFLIWGGYSAVGSDAGWWIPLMAGRENTMPPQYALLNEQPADPTYSQRVIDLTSQLKATSPASVEGVQLLCEWGITHIYIGQGQGMVGAGAVQLFSPNEFATSPAFNQVYHQDRVQILALNPQACGSVGE